MRIAVASQVVKDRQLELTITNEIDGPTALHVCIGPECIELRPTDVSELLSALKLMESIRLPF